MSFIKLAATLAVATPTFKIFADAMKLPLADASIGIFLAGLAGAGLSMFFGDPIEGKRNLWGQVLGSAIFGTTIATMLSDAMGWSWAVKNPYMFALIVAALTRWWLPSIITRGKQIIGELNIPWPGKKKKEEESK